MEKEKIKLYEKYVSSHYGLLNEINEQSLESDFKFYDRLYGKILPENKSVKILDIGCGMGHFLHYLIRSGYTNIAGIDICREQIELCKKHVTTKVEWVDVFSFLNKTDSYDVIVMNDVLEHFKKNEVIDLLELSYTKLNTEGLLVIKVPNVANPFNLKSFYDDFTHETHFTQRSLTQILLTTGFKVIKIYGQPPNKSTVKGMLGGMTEKVIHKLIKVMYILQRFHFDRRIILSKNLIVISKKSNEASDKKSALS